MTQTTELIASKQCRNCATGLLARDKFCRRCGVRQSESNTAETDSTRLTECETKPLTGNVQEFHSYSGQLIQVVTQSLLARTVPQQPNRGLQRLVCTLITIPIWMLIVLLSPLDAYAAAKTAAGGVNAR